MEQATMLKWGRGKANNIPKATMEKLLKKSKIPVLKLFNPCGAATWFLSEAEIHRYPDDESLREPGETWKAGDIEDIHFFGLCDLGMGFPELGYVSYNELAGLKLRFGLQIERDMWWDNKDKLTFDDLLAKMN